MIQPTNQSVRYKQNRILKSEETPVWDECSLKSWVGLASRASFLVAPTLPTHLPEPRSSSPHPQPGHLTHRSMKPCDAPKAQERRRPLSCAPYPPSSSESSSPQESSHKPAHMETEFLFQVKFRKKTPRATKP